MDTPEQIVSDLITNFKLYPSFTSTGSVKRHTIHMVEDWATRTLRLATDKIPLTVESEFNLAIKGTLSKNLDKAILNSSRDVLVHVELKSYGDIDMLGRFVADSHRILQHYPKVKNVALCLQPATPLSTFITDCEHFSTIEYGTNVFLFTLVDKDRKYKKDKEYLLDYDSKFLIDRTNEIVDRLAALLK